MVFLRRAAERRDINDSGDLFELPSQHPVLNGFEIGQALPLTDHIVPVDCSDGGPG